MYPVDTPYPAGLAMLVDAEHAVPEPRNGRHATVFVVGLDARSAQMLKRLPWAGMYDFRSLLTPAELERDSLGELHAKARKELEAFEGQIGAIVGFHDYPGSVLVSLLCAEHGLPGLAPDAVLKCEHRYWSRLEQREVIDELPDFGVVDLDHPEPPEGVPFPMWLKSFSPGFAVEVRDGDEFAAAARKFRTELLGGPIGWDGVPGEGAACLAEGALHGVRASVEGYVRNGQVVIYGALDTVTYPGSRSVLRHQYPSQLGEDAVRRMEEIAGLVMKRIGFDNGTFGMQFFCDPASGQVCLLKIVPAHSPAHAELFERVDGVASHEIMVRLGLGEDPGRRRRKGAYQIAGNCCLRHFTDAVVTRVPSPAEIATVTGQIDGIRVEIVPRPGQRLSELPRQDREGFELARIFVAAHTEYELTQKYQACVSMLPFMFDTV
jgi:hypothetical protein